MAKPATKKAQPAPAKPVKSRIVEAVGHANAASASGVRRPQFARAMEQAMSEAVLLAQKDGLTDPVDIRTRMLVAREKVRQAFK